MDDQSSTLSNYEQHIYNSYLAITNTAKNQPFKLRKKFDNFDPVKANFLKKLNMFFQKYKHINIDDFFKAPFYTLNDQHFDLSFYTTRKAINCYSLYMKTKENMDPDGDEQINNVKNGIKFLINFCRRNNIDLDQYKTMNANILPICIQHLKEHTINFYILHALDNDTVIKSIPAELLQFTIGEDFYKTYQTTYNKYIKSKKLKPMLRQTLKIINKSLKSNKTII
jgi:hypothetical protein